MGIGRSRVGEEKNAALRGERGEFTNDPGVSFTLPSRFYLDAEIQRLEAAKIFQRAWIYVGHQSEITNVGDYFVDSVAGQSIVVLRDQDLRARAFFNVCQHRGHELLENCGHLRQGIVCPYHGWTYALDGALRHARHTEKLQNFDPRAFGLKEIRLAVCAGLMMVNLSHDAPAFDDEYDGLAATFLGHLPNLAGFTKAFHFNYDIAANWKVVVDNFSEGYHIPVAHRLLSQVLDVEAANESIVRQRYSAFKSGSKTGYPGFELRGGEPYLSWVIWPNLCVLSQPGCENLIVLRMSPAGAGACHERVDIIAPCGDREPNLLAVRDLFVEHFNREDIGIVESVQRGLSSIGYDQGRYVGGDEQAWYSESGLHRFHQQIVDALF